MSGTGLVCVIKPTKKDDFVMRNEVGRETARILITAASNHVTAFFGAHEPGLFPAAEFPHS